MKFIIPQNYDFKNKLFGFMDYSTAIFNVVWALLMFIFVNIFPFSINIKIGLFILFYFPLLLFSFFGFNNENILYVSCYIFKFIKNSNVYFYGKDWQISLLNIQLISKIVYLKGVFICGEI